MILCTRVSLFHQHSQSRWAWCPCPDWRPSLCYLSAACVSSCSSCWSAPLSHPPDHTQHSSHHNTWPHMLILAPVSWWRGFLSSSHSQPASWSPSVPRPPPTRTSSSSSTPAQHSWDWCHQDTRISSLSHVWTDPRENIWRKFCKRDIQSLALAVSSLIEKPNSPVTLFSYLIEKPCY